MAQLLGARKATFAGRRARLAVTLVRIAQAIGESDLPLAELHETVEARGAAFLLRGRYDERFRPVVDAFIENFRVEEELGAGASIVLDGETVVDLWGGWARADHSQEWDEHSTVCMMSVAKGVTGICFNMAIDRGLIDPDERIATYWPEFAQNGKADITRFKGLGEMMPKVLWDTTLNPKTRRLQRVTIENALKTDRVISDLMGKDPEPRFNLIKERAPEVEQLDI